MLSQFCVNNKLNAKTIYILTFKTPTKIATDNTFKYSFFQFSYEND